MSILGHFFRVVRKQVLVGNGLRLCILKGLPPVLGTERINMTHSFAHLMSLIAQLVAAVYKETV